MLSNSANIWSGLLRREIISICLFLFTVDTIIGTISPTLSLFAHSLGASLTLVGVLATTVGVARLISGSVIGGISDRRGRKRILLIAISLMGVAGLLYALTSIPYLLILVNALFGASFVAALTVGIAYAADATTPGERSLVFGLTSTAMGLGFALGSLLGGSFAANWGYPAAYLLAASMSVLGFLVIWQGIPAEPLPARSGDGGRPWPQQFEMLMSNAYILAACFGTLLMNLIFGGLVITFFPLYAHGLGIGQATIGSMFATRALASTAARLPAGVIGTIFPVHYLMLTALVISTGVAFSLPQLIDPTLLVFFLAAEGIGFGLFLTSAQTTIAAHADQSSRGAALGLYMAAASVGDSVSPFLLGLLADNLGIRSVFYVVGGLVGLGLLVMTAILARARRDTAPNPNS
jgi:MFS family permease